METDFSQTYQHMTDEELASLCADIDSLTVDARTALVAETDRRGLHRAHLVKLHTDRMRREARYDKRRAIHRGQVLGYILRVPPKWAVPTAIAWLLLGLICLLVGIHRR